MPNSTGRPDLAADRRADASAEEEDVVDRLSTDVRNELGGLDRTDFELGKRIVRLGVLLEDVMVHHLNRLGITRADYDVIAGLLSIGEPYEMRPTDLRDHTLLSSGGTTNVLNRLASAGAIERIPDTSDGRSSLVRLTPAGAQLARSAIRTMASVQSELFERVPEDVRRTAADALRQVLISLGDRAPLARRGLAGPIGRTRRLRDPSPRPASD